MVAKVGWLVPSFEVSRQTNRIRWPDDEGEAPTIESYSRCSGPHPKLKKDGDSHAGSAWMKAKRACLIQANQPNSSL